MDMNIPHVETTSLVMGEAFSLGSQRSFPLIFKAVVKYALSCLLSVLPHGSNRCYKKLLSSSEKDTVLLKLHINGFFSSS